MKGVLLSFIDFENPTHNMDRLVSRVFSPEAKLSRTNSIIEVMSQTFLN